MVNPQEYLHGPEYVAFWHHFFVLFQGWWPRVMASLALFFAFWMGIYRRRPIAGMILFGIAVFIAYFTGFLAVLVF